MKAMFTKVEYQLGPIPQEAVWDGVLQADSMWCYSEQGSFKMKLRETKNNYQHKKTQAKKLQKWILENFESSKMYEKFYEALRKECQILNEEELQEMFSSSTQDPDTVGLKIFG